MLGIPVSKIKETHFDANAVRNLTTFWLLMEYTGLNESVMNSPYLPTVQNTIPRSNSRGYQE